jgi:hypothetical protein
LLNSDTGALLLKESIIMRKSFTGFTTVFAIIFMAVGMSGITRAEAIYSYMNYYNRQNNRATFELLEEAGQSGAAAVISLYGNGEKQFKPHPALESFPEKSVFVYRSANLYGGQTAARNNTAVVVFAEHSFRGKEDALGFLTKLGLIEQINSVTGSIILVTPADPDVGFTGTDLKNYYTLHDVLFTQKASERTDKGIVYYSDAEYCGAYGKVYFIGIEGGATFINNYIAPGRHDCIDLCAGLMLIGGEMEPSAKISKYVPVYILNGSQTAIEQYCKVNGTDTYRVEGGIEVFYNQTVPLRRVMVAKNKQPELSTSISDAFRSLFLQAQRVSVIRSMTQETVKTPPYLDYVPAPEISRYALYNRNAIVNNVTAKGGLRVSFHQEEIFNDLKTKYDQYLQTWYEFIPQEVLDGTAAKGSVPLIIALHGTGDDPLMFVDEIGLLEVAGREKVAMIAPFEEGLVIVHQGSRVVMGAPVSEGILVKALPRLIDHILKKFPALDGSRVYAAGYSLGGGATLRAIYGGMEKIAAAVPMAGMHDDLVYFSTPEEDARLLEIGMPVMILTSTFDLGFNQQEGRLTDNTLRQLRHFARVNRIQLADAGDFSANPIIGYPADRMDVTTLAGEWRSFLWSFKNGGGIPILSVSCTENLTHALYPGYGEIAWDFMKHFARDPETGKLLYISEIRGKPKNVN